MGSYMHDKALSPLQDFPTPSHFKGLGLMGKQNRTSLGL